MSLLCAALFQSWKMRRCFKKVKACVIITNLRHISAHTYTWIVSIIKFTFLISEGFGTLSITAAWLSDSNVPFDKAIISSTFRNDIFVLLCELKM